MQYIWTLLFLVNTYHKHFFVAFVDSMVIHHANNGNAQVAPDPERNAESQARQDGDDVPPR